MKISKLFHWLYASVMLLPLFAIGVTCLYTIFNKNAKDSYYGESINNSEVLSASRYLDDNTLYTWAVSNQISDIPTVGSAKLLVRHLHFNYCDTPANNQLDLAGLQAIEEDIVSFSFSQNAYNANLYFWYDDSTYVAWSYIVNLHATPSFKTMSFSFYLSKDYDYQYDKLQDNLTYIQYNKDSYLDNSFYYATRLLKESNYFNWAKDSFLAQPITYITSLFGMDNYNIVIYLLSYWLDISIIWLTFDLVMYVPLLVHRWLDKGVLE